MTNNTLTFGVLPKFEDFETAFENLCPDGFEIKPNPADCALLDWVDAPLDTFDMWDLEQTWEALARLTNCWANGDPYAGDAAGTLASAILTVLGFEWV